MTDDEITAGIYRARQRKALPVFVAILAYPFLVGWLWSKSAYPESFGVHPGLGRGGVYVRWWDSYRLLERHRLWDVITLICMWPGVICLITWAVVVTPKTRAISDEERAIYVAHSEGDAR